MVYDFNTQMDASVLRIEGELDAMSVVDIRPLIAGVSEDRPLRVVVDLCRLRLIDSLGVGVIIALFKAVRAYGGNLDVIGVRDQPLAVLRLLRLDRVLMRGTAQ